MQHSLKSPDLPDTAEAGLRPGDACAHAFGIRVLESGHGQARLSMRVRDDMLNAHGICHGGMTYLLADTALAYALDRQVVTTSAHVVYPAPARLGDVLTAECRLLHDGGKAGVFDVTVHTGHGAQVLLMRGQTLRVNPSS